MYVADRKALYETILQHRPRYCYEIGTYTGGGSTFFLASAFAKIGSGKVITLERSDALYRRAIESYRTHLPNLLPYIEFIHGADLRILQPYIVNDAQDPLCFLLDGAEDSHETMDQYEFFRPFLKPKSRAHGT